ncbi:MAG: hypothetical protein JW860_11000 [Sedimentisphaerales bacterium]|nr:hypothetical protein [Sedimentisphaerales bacterium]
MSNSEIMNNSCQGGLGAIGLGTGGSADGLGGGIYGSGIINNCVIVENTCTAGEEWPGVPAEEAGARGGGLYVFDDTTIINCTIAYNELYSEEGGYTTGGGICKYGVTDMEVTNSIIWHNINMANYMFQQIGGASSGVNITFVM